MILHDFYYLMGLSNAIQYSKTLFHPFNTWLHLQQECLSHLGMLGYLLHLSDVTVMCQNDIKQVPTYSDVFRHFLILLLLWLLLFFLIVLLQTLILIVLATRTQVNLLVRISGTYPSPLRYPDLSCYCSLLFSNISDNSVVSVYKSAFTVELL